MADKNIVSAREGFFTLDFTNPYLSGSRCTACSTYYFPSESHFCRNPDCDSESFEELTLSRRGRIWSYTNAAYPPPPPYVQTSDPYKAVAIAAVELEKEKMVVLGQLAEGITVDDVKIGDEVELALETLYEDDENRYVVWKWKPAAGGQE